MTNTRRAWGERVLEPLLALAVLAGVIYTVFALLYYGYLPQPFFYQAYDVWMDWFNTAYWAHHHEGAYDSWQTLYPPASFVLMKFLTFGPCYVDNEGWPSRDCDVYGAITLHAWYVLNVFLIGKTFLKIDRKTALPRSFALAAGMPMLDGLERGNLILCCFTFFLLAFGPLLKSARMRWFFAGLAINFKIYLIGTIFAYPLKRRWRWFEGALLMTLGVYLLTWGVLGVGTPIEIYNNLSFWGSVTASASSLLDLWYATSYQPLIGLFESSTFPSLLILGSWRTEFFGEVLSISVRVVQLTIVLAAAVAWLRPESVPTFRIVNLATCIALITTETGGYTQSLMILLVFFERWRGFGVPFAIVLCYILSIPGEIYIDPVYPLLHARGFLNSGAIFYSYWITVGPFVRPALILLIPFTLALVTLADVWRDIRAQGWRERWRFRRDLPIMTGQGEALAPGRAVRA